MYGKSIVTWCRYCRSTKEAGPPSDTEPTSPSGMILDEPTAPVVSKRKSGTAGKKQPPATKDFVDLFEDDMDDGGGDMAATSKRRRHGEYQRSVCKIYSPGGAKAVAVYDAASHCLRYYYY